MLVVLTVSTQTELERKRQGFLPVLDMTDNTVEEVAITDIIALARRGVAVNEVTPAGQIYSYSRRLVKAYLQNDLSYMARLSSMGLGIGSVPNWSSKRIFQIFHDYSNLEPGRMSRRILLYMTQYLVEEQFGRVTRRCLLQVRLRAVTHQELIGAPLQVSNSKLRYYALDILGEDMALVGKEVVLASFYFYTDTLGLFVSDCPSPIFCGAECFSGYYTNERKSKELLSRDGFTAAWKSWWKSKFVIGDTLDLTEEDAQLGCFDLPPLRQ